MDQFCRFSRVHFPSAKEFKAGGRRDRADLQEEMVGTVLLGLRLLRDRFAGILPALWHGAVCRFPEAVRRFTDLGLLEEDGGYLRLTAKGLPLTNFVWQEFVEMNLNRPAASDPRKKSAFAFCRMS